MGKQMTMMSLNLLTFGPVSSKDEELNDWMHDWIRIELLQNNKYNI